MARIAVMGAGGVGGAFGALLQRSGHDVTFIARGANLDALRARGLRVTGALGTIELPSVDARDAAGRADLVLLCVKRYDLDDALAALGSSDALVLTLQNGVDAADVAVARLGPRVLAGTTGIVADLVAPGHVEVVSTYARIRFGEPDGGGITERVSRVAGWLGVDGVTAVPEADVRVALWQKMALICAMAGLTTARDAAVGAVRDDPVFAAVIREVEAVARASGVPLPDGFADERLGYAATVDASATSSMLRDVRRGRRIELPWLNGAIVRLGAELGVPTPANAGVVGAIVT